MNGSRVATASVIASRLRAHWPHVRCIEAGETDAWVIRIAVADDYWIEAQEPTPEGVAWSVRPLILRADGSTVDIPGFHENSVGLNADADLLLVADRLYEELRFWYREYAAVATRGAEAVSPSHSG